MTIPPPWRHQREDTDASWEMPAAAIHWDPRCGKSRVIIDTCDRLWGEDKITGAVVLAPGGVHLNWSQEEIPTWWDHDQETNVLEWVSAKARTKRAEHVRERALEETDKFLWVCAGVEALGTDLLDDFLRRLVRVRKGRLLLAVDESHCVKNPSAKRTKKVIALSREFAYRRTLTGTPVALNPFDLWSQYNILDPGILGRYFAPFRQRYGVFRRQSYGGPTFMELVGFQNLSELRERIAPHTFTRFKKDCLDLPPQVVSRETFILDPEQRRVYDSLREDMIAVLDDGTEISSTQAMTNLLRLQQVSRGHVRDPDGRVVRVGAKMPAAEAVLRMVEENQGKTIVWAQFLEDVDQVGEILKKAGVNHVVCDGRTPQHSRPELRRQFKSDDAVRVWLGTPGSGGVGVDLGAANLMIFYSHGFNMVERDQAIDRNYGSSQKAPRVDVVDLIGDDTVDRRAMDILYKKQNLAATITGRTLRDLLREGHRETGLEVQR